MDAKCWISADPSIADFNSDGSVDTADYVVLRKGFATGAYTQDDYNVWRQNFGAPSPGAAAVDLLCFKPAFPNRIRSRWRHLQYYSSCEEITTIR